MDEQAGPQGASGSRIRYFDVTSANPHGAISQDVLVTKDASLLERRLLDLLARQGCAVPPVYVPDVNSDARLPVYMPYLAERPRLDFGHPASPLTQSIAEGLAGIHAANRQQPPPWLPHTAESYH